MSHFTVMVVGDVDENLAPFHEYECTGVLDEFVIMVDETETYRSYHGDDSERTLMEYISEDYGDDIPRYTNAEVDAFLAVDPNWKERHFRVDEKGELIAFYRLTNPNKKWDWYVVGGRWRGYLLGKDGQQHSSLLKSEIDVTRMRDDAGTRAAEMFDKAMAGVEPDWKSWQIVREQFEDIADAREYYHDQPSLKVVKDNLGAESFFFEYDQLLIGRDRYIKQARDGAVATFAFLQDRNWVESGEMGWFGMASNKKDADDWNAQFTEHFDALPDDALISIVDCHI